MEEKQGATSNIIGISLKQHISINTKREYRYSVRPITVLALLFVRRKLGQVPVIGIIERKD